MHNEYCANPQCTGNEPQNARLVEGSDQNLTVKTNRTLYANAATAAGKKCAYLCTLPYVYSNGQCVEDEVEASEDRDWACQGYCVSNSTYYNISNCNNISLYDLKRCIEKSLLQLQDNCVGYSRNKCKNVYSNSCKWVENPQPICVATDIATQLSDGTRAGDIDATHITDCSFESDSEEGLSICPCSGRYRQCSPLP